MSIGAQSIGPQGLGQSTLELLADEKKLNKTLASLKQAQEDAQKAIDLAGPATEIVAIRAQVGAELEAAQEATAKAVADGQAIVDDAHGEAKKIVDAAHQKAAEVASEFADEAAEKNKLLDERKSTIAAVERKLEQRAAQLQGERDQITRAQDQLDERGAALDARAAELDELNSSLLQEKTKLAEAREHLNTALG